MIEIKINKKILIQFNSIKYILLFNIFLLMQSCIQLPYGSNIRTAIIRTINKDTINFYGSKKKFILKDRSFLKIKDTIQYSIINNGNDKELPIIIKL